MKSEKEILELKKQTNGVRRKVLEIAVRANGGHVSTAFSLTELFVALYHGGILNYDPANPLWEERDRFILSEGQAGLGLYPVLAEAGFFPKEDLDHFAEKGSTLGTHSESHTKGIEFLTGSLGYGLSLACGCAHAAKLFGKRWMTFCITGDGELFEGSNYEAMLTVSRLMLNNLVLIVNRNHQMTIGYTDRRDAPRDVVLDPLDSKLEAFGFDVRTIDGHNFYSIFDGFADIRYRSILDPRPLAIIAETVKGKGSSVIAGRPNWHYVVPRGDDLQTTETELNLERLALEKEGE